MNKKTVAGNEQDRGEITDFIHEIGLIIQTEHTQPLLHSLTILKLPITTTILSMIFNKSEGAKTSHHNKII